MTASRANIQSGMFGHFPHGNHSYIAMFVLKQYGAAHVSDMRWRMWNAMFIILNADCEREKAEPHASPLPIRRKMGGGIRPHSGPAAVFVNRARLQVWPTIKIPQR